MADPFLIVVNNIVTKCKQNAVNVVIPDGVTQIAESAFERLKTLKTLEIPDSVQKIGARAFDGCLRLSGIVIPDGVQKIDNSTFGYCKSLESIVIPEGVTEIGEMVFINCDSLSSVTLPASLRKIGKSAFLRCVSLGSIEFGGTMAEWAAVEKAENWAESLFITTVKCTDGEAEINSSTPTSEETEETEEQTEKPESVTPEQKAEIERFMKMNEEELEKEVNSFDGLLSNFTEKLGSELKSSLKDKLGGAFGLFKKKSK